MIEQALEYVNKWGFSVIPLLPNKKPLIRWEEYQSRYPTEEEIIRWWTKYPDSMIGIVTGKLSNLAVIDIDVKDSKLTEILPNVQAPLVDTPRGYHWYFRYENGITNTVNVLGEKIDIRGEGGYVVAPPSINEERKRYIWATPLTKIDRPKFPIEIMSQPETRFEKPKTTIGGIDETFIEGRRDEDLFHTAHTLVKGGMDEESIRKIVGTMAMACEPPFNEREAQTKVDSAVKRAIRKERPLAKEVEEWVLSTQGWFSSTEIYSCLQLSTRDEKKNVSIILRRLVDNDVIERHPSKNGWFRRIELDCEPINWREAPTDDMPIELPLDIHKMVNIYPGNIIIIAGFKDAGKTAFLLNFIKLNMNRYEIKYFSSEMGGSELKLRLGFFKDVKESDWKFQSRERQRNFADVIYPNAVNVIDYMEIVDDFWMVGKYLQDIDAKLKEGIAIIALQKPRGRDVARGGDSSLDKPRLYLAMNPGEIKIISAKNWKGKRNPRGLVREFKLYSGTKFVPISDWDEPFAKPTVDKQGRFMV